MGFPHNYILYIIIIIVLPFGSMEVVSHWQIIIIKNHIEFGKCSARIRPDSNAMLFPSLFYLAILRIFSNYP